MKKHRIFAVMSLLAMILLTLPVQAAKFDNKVLDGLVYIEAIYVDVWGDVEGAAGTGFFVGKKGENPRYIITNYHVIEDYVVSGHNGLIQVYYDQNNYDEAYHVEHNAQLDIALLRLINPTDKRKPLPLKVISQDDAQGQQVFAVGFPGLVDTAVLRKSYYGKEDATVTNGVINRLTIDLIEGRQEIQHSALITSGNSGGPLVDAKGRVIGINTRAFTAANYSLAVSIEDALPLLNRNNVNAWIVADDGIPLWLILTIAGGALVIILVIILIVVLTSKKPAAAANVAAPVGANVQVPVGVGTGGGYQAPTRSPFIRSMAAQHNGISAPLGRNPIMIGRDASVCKIIFKEDTPGVSSRHCQVYFDDSSNSFILTDLGSSYGTFLMNGQQLAANTPTRLNTKDYFYLASKDNTFIVDME